MLGKVFKREYPSSTSMRVLWVYKSPWKKPGPIVYMGVLNALAMVACGIETELFVEAGDDSVTEADLREFYGVEPHPKLHIHRISGKQERGFPLISRRAVYESALGQLKAHLNARRDEEVLLVTRELGILPPLLRLRKRNPNLRILHEAHDFFGRINHLPRRGLRDYRRWISERLYIPRVDGLICITEPQRKLYAEVFPRLPNISLPLGCVDPRPNADFERRRRARTLGYVGHLTEKKGYGLLLQAAGQLRPYGVTLECHGGYPDQVKRLRNEIENRGLADCVHLEPFHGPSEMFNWLAEKVSIGVAPLQDTFYNRNLTCPVKVLDFLSQGLPIVGSDIPCVRDLAGRAGEYHRPNDAASFVSAVLSILDNPARYHAMACESLARAQTLKWSNRAASLLDFASSLKPSP